jgi:acetyltransferase-like isoleucine patch superfamily enzyme
MVERSCCGRKRALNLSGPKYLLLRAETKMRTGLHRCLGVVLHMYLRLHGCTVGGGLKCKSWPIFREIPSCNIAIGDHCTIGYRVTFHVGRDGLLKIGDHVRLTQDILISAFERVEIADYCGIAENVSIRDADHGMDANRPFLGQLLSAKPILIGRDVVISAGCRILRGSVLPEGVMIGANSVVTEKSLLEPYGIYAGTPIRKIRSRIGAVEPFGETDE